MIGHPRVLRTLIVTTFAIGIVVAAAGCRVATLGLLESGISSGDGLGLRYDMGGKVVAVTADGRELPAGFARLIVPGGFYLRPAGQANATEILGRVWRDGESMNFAASPAGLEMSATFQPKADRIEVSGRVSNPAGDARCVSIGFALPVDAGGWAFGRSINCSERITTANTYAEWTCADSDWDGRQINRGMITPIYSEAVGLAMGAVSDHPEIFRVCYRQGLGFAIEIDLGLSPLPAKFRNETTFKFIIYRFNPAEHYRGALAKYYAMWPEDYASRGPGKPASFANLGEFACSRISGTGAALSPDALRRAIYMEWAKENSTGQGTCATFGPDSQLRVWNGCVPMNPDPELPEPNWARRDTQAIAKEGRDSRQTTTVIENWSDSAGRYLDNFRADHFQFVDWPLTYNFRTGRPVQFGAFMWREFALPLAENLHRQGRLLAAESRPWRMSVMFDQPMLDVHVASDAPEHDLDAMAYMRSLVGAKPISGSGRFVTSQPDRRERAQLERELNIGVPYCWFPGGAGPKDLWDKYCVPMQEMAAAGWEPVTGVAVIHPDMVVERYGGADDAKVFYAIHNRGESPLACEIAIDLKRVNMDPKTVAIVDRLTGKSPDAATLECCLVTRVQLDGRGSAILELSRTGGHLPAGGQLSLQCSSPTSSEPPLPPFDTMKYGSPQLAPTMKRLNLSPLTATRFLDAYRTEKRDLAAAVAFHMKRDGERGDATELANWLAPRYAGIYEAVLPAPALAEWTAMRKAEGWRLAAGEIAEGNGSRLDVIDPLLEIVPNPRPPVESRLRVTSP
jgi:hypothetical protein